MDNSQGKIGLKEFLAIILLTVGTKLADNTPKTLYEELGNAAWISIILISLITLIPVLLLTKLCSLYPEKNLTDIILHLFGKYLGWLVLFICWFMQTYALFYNTAIYSDIIKTLYFNNTPYIVISILLITVSAYGAKKGIESIGSSSWISLFLIKITLLFILAFTFIQGEIDFLFPLLGEGVWVLMKESYYHSSIFTEFIFLFFIASKVKDNKVLNKGVWIALTIVTIEFAFALIGYVMLFDFYGIKIIEYPFHETIRYIQLGFLTNSELLFFPFWLVSSFIRITFYLYLSALLFGATFKIKQFEYIVPTISTIIVFAGLIPESVTYSVDQIREGFLRTITPFIIFLPIILWVTAKLKGEFKNDKT